MLDLVIRGGTVYDGTGSQPVHADVAISGQSIVGVGSYGESEAGAVLEADCLVVAPGFINVLSHSYFSVLADPRCLSELTQGVTTEVFGEGHSMGPLNPLLRSELEPELARDELTVDWTHLSEYLALVERRGSAPNVCSFIGATTIREHVLGHRRRPPTPAELDTMRGLVDEEMADGALGIGSALIYPPGFFASTDELAALCQVAARHGGSYISHMRSEGVGLLDAVDELIGIAEAAGCPAEIYHLKAAGRTAWPKMEEAVGRVEQARERGTAVTADMYPYTAGGTSLAASIPPWYHEGGPEALARRLDDAGTRAEIREAVRTSQDGWENLYLAAGGAEGVLILSAGEDERRFVGRTVAEAAGDLGVDPAEAVVELVRRTLVPSAQGIHCAYFIISEDNLRWQLQLPWVSIGSDASAIAAEGRHLQESAHPRAYGAFARFLGHYVRDEQLIPLAEGIRRLTSLPAENLGLAGRGRLAPGCHADVVVFDAQRIGDRATYEDPHRYSEGVRDVVVNGAVTLRDGSFTGSLAGRHLRRGRQGGNGG